MDEKARRSQEDILLWLWLGMVLGVGNGRALRLAEQHQDKKSLYYVMHDPDCGLLTDRERKRVREVSLSHAGRILEWCKKNGIGIMTWDSELYPDSLRQIYQPPTVLFFRGNPHLLRSGMVLTVVGTRKPTPYSLKVTDWLCRDLARCSIVIASGCAVGLDAAAHQAALREGKPTIGVLGCGIDVDYPKENRALKEQIVQNGLLMTEYFPGTPPHGANFPVRNRILAGVGEAALVLQAPARSGALITANLACEQGKSVFCVPPADLFDARYSGVMDFMRDGAYPVFNHMDVLYSFYMSYPHRLSLYDETGASRTQDSLLFAAGEEGTKTLPRRKRRPLPEQDAAADDTAPETEKEKSPSLPEEVTEEQRRIIELLADGPQSVNGICTRLGFSFEQTSLLLMELEMTGCIVNTERDVFVLPEAAGE